MKREDKFRTTCLERYGVDNVSKLPAVRQKIKQKLTHSAKKVQEKINKRCNFIKLDTSTYVNSHTKARFIDKDYGEWWTKPYVVVQGHNHPLRSLAIKSEKGALTLEKVLFRLKKVPFIKIDENDYVNTTTKCRFFDIEFGEFFAKPCEAFNGLANHPLRTQRKRSETNIRKYGFANFQQNREIGLKTARSSNKCFILNHWKTKEEVICVGSYEKKVVEYLNQNKINFQWQPKVFKTPFKTIKGNIKTYRPDLYLVDEDRWIEIKGYFRRDAEEKWDWFHKTYPNSELWNEKMLKEMKIL